MLLRNSNFLLFSFVSLVFLFFASGVPWHEANLQYLVARSFLDNGSLGLSQLLDSNLQIGGPSGLFYDVHNLANSIFAIPIVAFVKLIEIFVAKDLEVVGRFIFSLTGILWCSLSILFYYKTCLLFEFKKRESFLSALLLAFSSIIFQYSSLNYEGNIYLFSAIASFYFYQKYVKQKNVKDIFYFGLSLGLAINSRDLSLILVVSYIIVAISHFIKKEILFSDLMVFLLGFSPGLLLFSFYNFLRTGSFLTLTLFHGLDNKNWGAINPTNPFWEGFTGQLFSPGSSLFIYSPLLIICLYYAWKNRKIFTYETKIILYFTFLVKLCVIAKIPNWPGYSGIGNRYTYVLLPFLFLTLPLALEARGIIKKLTYSFGLWGAFLQVSLSSINWKPLLIIILNSSDHSAQWKIKYSLWIMGLKEFFKKLSFTPLDTDLNMLSGPSQFASRTFFSWWMRFTPMGGNLWMSFAAAFTILLLIIFTGRKVFRALN